MTILIFLVAALWLAVIALGVMVFIMLRQIGVLYERVAPVGAMMDSAGPKVGEAAPVFELMSLTETGATTIGGERDRATLLFFLSPTCPVCKQLLPGLLSMKKTEGAWLDIVLASDGSEAKHRQMIEERGLSRLPYVLSPDLGMTYRVQRLPFGVLIDRDGIVRAKGLINNREHIDSLLNTLDAGAASIQEFEAQRQSA
jgi:methylamine dehydrogenase accessory protein MauD